MKRAVPQYFPSRSNGGKGYDAVTPSASRRSSAGAIDSHVNDYNTHRGSSNNYHKYEYRDMDGFQYDSTRNKYHQNNGEMLFHNHHQNAHENYHHNLSPAD